MKDYRVKFLKDGKVICAIFDKVTEAQNFAVTCGGSVYSREVNEWFPKIFPACSVIVIAVLAVGSILFIAWILLGG